MNMTPHTEHAASTAAQSVEWRSLAISATGAGTSAGLTAAQISDWVSIAAGIVSIAAGIATLCYTALKIIEWFDARSARAQQTQSLERLHDLWEKRAMARSRPAPLDDQSHHEGK